MSGAQSILVIDDDAEVRAYLELALQAIGRPVQCAEALPAALDGVALALVDLLLADGRSGVPAVEALTAAGVPTLIMSGLPPEAPVVQAALAAGAGALLNKPFSLADLRAAVSAALPE